MTNKHAMEAMKSTGTHYGRPVFFNGIRSLFDQFKEIIVVVEISLVLRRVVRSLYQAGKKEDVTYS